jgi:cellulose synthase operon protein C
MGMMMNAKTPRRQQRPDAALLGVLAPWRLILLLVVALASPVLADEMTERIIPWVWMRNYLPEELPEIEKRAYHDTLDIAEKQAFFGRYRHALITLTQAPADADRVRVALVRATAQNALGREERALETLSAEGVANHPRAAVLRGQVLAKLGRHEEAVEVLQAHLKAHPADIPGRHQLGVIHELRGDTAAAIEAFAWFAEEPQSFYQKWSAHNDPVFDSAENIVAIGRALDRWAIYTGAYTNNPRLHNDILAMYVKAYDVIDRDYWPARVAAAQHFLDHDSDEQAMEELAAAVDRNPNAESALRLIGKIHLDHFNFDGAEAAILQMREVDQTSVEAALIEARNLLRQRRPRDAEVSLQRVLAEQPRHVEAMGLLAASFALQLREEEMNALLKQVESFDPDNASAHFEVAEQLGAMRQYPRSAAMYKVAIERAPWWTAPRNGLGLLYTQSGDEDDARTVLEQARQLDPYNLRTTNYLRLLDDMARMARHETEHFVVMYDQALDPVIPEYFGEYLESIHADVAETFKHEPSVKTYIEVFPTHDAFSVRTTGSPWIGTVGASTGRVIALVSPRDGKKTLGTFNWAQVLRHEYVHTVTLSATDNRIAHWMTEGLAVLEERTPLRWEWVPMLNHAVRNDELFTMDELTWGFVRPRRPIDRQLAYAQSYWVCLYIQETFGHEKLLAMMEAFKRGLGQDEVFAEVLERSTSQFTEEFFAWTRKQVDSWGYDRETSAKVEELKAEGEEFIKSREYDKAIAAWLEIAKLRPVDALPHQRLAGIYLATKQPTKAIEHLDRLHKVSLKDHRYAVTIARTYRDMGKLDEAVRYAKEAVYINPYDLRSHQLLAELFEKAGNAEGAAREKRVIAMLEAKQKD